jgi:NTE family protein
LAITATNYANSDRVTFVQGNDKIKPWKKVRRRSEMCEIGSSHVMASTAIPIFFPPVQVDNAFYGDGCLRNLTPLSPAIKLGAKNLIVVGVQKEIKLHDPGDGTLQPTFARVVSVVTNAILMDNVYMDIERMTRINETVKLLEEKGGKDNSLRPINIVHIRPSDDIGKIAFEESEKLPATLKFLIDGLGSRREAAELISYLLFEGPYCQRLIDLGYKDAYAQEKEIVSVLKA